MGLSEADKVLGLVLVGVWLCLPLYTLECVQAWRYFHDTGKRDSWYLWCLVWFVIINDAAMTVDQCAMVYHTLITRFGQDPASILGEVSVALPIHDFLLVFTSGITQIYLALRVLKLSNNNWILFAILVTLSLGAQGMTLYEGYFLVVVPQFSERKRLFTLGYIFLSLQAGCDTAISSSLVFYLLKFWKQTTINKTRKVIQRLLVIGVESGAVTAAVALAIIISAALRPFTNWNVMFLLVFGRAYGNTFLFNLNIRSGQFSNTVTITYGMRSEDLTNAGASSSSAPSKGNRKASPEYHLSSIRSQQDPERVAGGLATHIHMESEELPEEKAERPNRALEHIPVLDPV